MKIDELRHRVLEDLEAMGKDDTLISNMKRISQLRPRPVSKNTERAQLARTQGNELFQQTTADPSQNYKILQLYHDSIAFAPKGSEDLAAAYGNISALLRRMFKFRDCISEADKALEITKSVPLQIKLLCRKAECFKALDLSDYKCCMEQAQVLFSKLEDSDEIKTKLNSFISRTQFNINRVILMNREEEIFDEIQLQVTKMIADAEKCTSIQDSVKMEYSEKYGQYLVAARDFEPGEIMFVEKPYLAQVIDCKTPSYCCHCMNFLWTIIACDHCSWHVYCSEQCKIEAWNNYHDVECDASQHMKKVIPIYENADTAPVGLFFKALKEAGSLSKLRAELESIDDCEGIHGETLESDEKFGSYKTLFRTRTRKLSEKELESITRFCSCLVIGLAKPVLNVHYDPYNLEKLMGEDLAVFLGACLLKLCIINKGRLQQLRCFDVAKTGCPNGSMNNVIALTFLLTPASCTPNVFHGFTYGNRCFTYALEPIKAGTQLFSSVWLSSIYDNTPKAERIRNFQMYHDFPCACQACTENWCETLYGPTQRDSTPQSKASIARELTAETKSIRREMETDSLRKLNLVDVKLIHAMKNLLKKVWHHFSMPSPIIFEAVKLMIELSELFFSVQNRLIYRKTDCQTQKLTVTIPLASQ